MFVKCKEIISSPNNNGTRKIELVGCQFANNGEVIEGTITFPNVYKSQENSFEYFPAIENKDSEIFTLYIPE